jgi:hypothetical protein
LAVKMTAADFGVGFMQALKAVPGVPNLKELVVNASTARMLNLHALALDPPDGPGYSTYPLFTHSLLNRSIIVKHYVRPGEDERLAAHCMNATKIIFPFDTDDLNLGGQFLFVDQQDFTGVLMRHLEYEGLAAERDIEVLRLLDGLPTLDPFLVREALVRRGLEVDPSYYRFSESDRSHMLQFVEGEIASLIALCFGQVEAGDPRAGRLSQLLLSDHASPDLEPLRLTLHMQGEQFCEAMFAWKAFLYYRWRAKQLAPELQKTARSIARISRRRYDTDGLRFVINAKELLEETISRAWRDINRTLRLYDAAYRGLTLEMAPERFRDFLKNGERFYIDLGERIGKLEQIASFWDIRLARHHTGGLSPDEVMDALRDLLQGLAIWPAGTRRRQAPEPEVALIEAAWPAPLPSAAG